MKNKDKMFIFQQCVDSCLTDLFILESLGFFPEGYNMKIEKMRETLMEIKSTAIMKHKND